MLFRSAGARMVEVVLRVRDGGTGACARRHLHVPNSNGHLRSVDCKEVEFVLGVQYVGEGCSAQVSGHVVAVLDSRGQGRALSRAGQSDRHHSFYTGVQHGKQRTWPC